MATILVVDDKPSNRSLLTTLLGYRGHRLVEACDGAEALDKARTEHPALVITDILMPKINGYQLVQQLRKDPTVKDIPVIFYSAIYLEPEARALARACGVSRVICKPAEPEEILRIVDDALASGSSPGLPPAYEDALNTTVVDILNDKLYRKVREFEELNTNLENIVAERTQELETAYHALQQHTLERQTAEQEIAGVREEQLKMKSQFLSHVSHELRSPLAVVYQSTTILLDGLAGTINESQRDYLDITLRNVTQLKHMIADLLEASRADIQKLAVRQSSIPIRPTIAHAIESFRAIAATKQILLQADVPDHLPPVYADAARISQVLANLLDNAIKFSNSKTSITVGARIFESDSKFVRISVADCGCGIEQEHRERIFERLYQVTAASQDGRRGLGLGLYICKELIILHGGRIWVDSQPGKGSTFLFTLPIFALRDLIASILKEGSQLPCSIALVTIKLHAAKASSEQERQRTCQTICQLLERCMLPDMDVLLPPQNRAGLDRFWIAARADEHGAGVLAARIRGQLSHCEDLRINDVPYSVTTEMVNPESQGNNWPWEKRVDSIASRLEEMLQTDVG